MNYEQLATDFINKNNIEFKAEFLKHDFYFSDDKDKRDIYNITLKRGKRQINLRFGQSLNNSGFKIVYKYDNYKKTKAKFKKTFTDPYLYTSKNISKDLSNLFYKNRDLFGCYSSTIDSFELAKAPTAYDVLACLTYQDPEDFENFCLMYGYDQDSIKAYKIFENVQEEYKKVTYFFSDREIDELQKII